MHHSYLDKYARQNSPLHRLDARLKVPLVLLLVTLVALVQHPSLVLVLTLIGLISALCLLARIHLDYLLLRSAVVLPFSGFAAISLAFTYGGEWGLTEPGLHRAAAMMLRSWIAVCFMILLINTTPFDQLLRALRSLKVPSIFVLLLSFLYRYLYLLWDEIERMQRARNVRYFGGRWSEQTALLGRLAAALFLRSYERAERVQKAMISRGWTGESDSINKHGVERSPLPPLIRGGKETLALKIEDLSFSYPDGTPALEGVSLEVPQGESLALIGPNGAGKSTLLLCLAGLLPFRGSIFIHGELLTESNARKVRQHLGLVFQDPDDQLFMPVLEEDVAFGPINMGLTSSEVEQRVRTALEHVNLLDKRSRPPHHLSYGEKRRAAIATALAMEPEILLLDEPTSNLDPATRGELTCYLKTLPATLIVSTHDLELAQGLCSMCAVISGGKLVALGKTEEILRNEGLLRANRLMA
jgi:cobalt/nickel transport system ATP-binding protein